MKKKDLIEKLLKEATTTKTKGTNEIGDEGAYNTSVFGSIVRRENLYHYIDQHLSYGVSNDGETPRMTKHNRLYRGTEGKKIQEDINDTERLIQDLYDFAVDNDYIMDDLIDIFNEAIAANQPQEKILQTIKNYVDHIVFLYDKFHVDEIKDDTKGELANKLFDAVKYKISMAEATSVGSALGGVDQGMYSQPAIFAKDRENWRNKDATYEGGEVIQRKNITNTVSNLKEQKLHEFLNETDDGSDEEVNYEDLEKKINEDFPNEDLGYHGGNLSDKSDYKTANYHGDQPFTGHYFFSDLDRAIGRGDRSQKENEIRSVSVCDFSQYNLAKPNTNAYWHLKSGLKEMVKLYFEKNSIESFFEESQFSKFSALQHSYPEIADAIKQNSNEIENILNDYSQKELDNEDKLDRVETSILKKMGFEGIDVRGLGESYGDASPDTSQEGSVIFNLKPGTYKVYKVYMNNKQENSKEQLKEKTLKEFTNAEGGNRYKVWDGAETVKIKRKCQDFPYCSEGAADNPIETEKLQENEEDDISKKEVSGDVNYSFSFKKFLDDNKKATVSVNFKNEDHQLDRDFYENVKKEDIYTLDVNVDNHYSNNSISRYGIVVNKKLNIIFNSFINNYNPKVILVKNHSADIQDTLELFLRKFENDFNIIKPKGEIIMYSNDLTYLTDDMRSKMEEKIQKIAEQTNKDFKKVRKIIKENSESDCKKKFEEKLFGEFEKWYGDAVEKNTEHENWVWDTLKEFIQGEFVSDDKDHIEDVFEELLECKNAYDDILKPDNVDTVFRGKSEFIDGLENLNWSFLDVKNDTVTYYADYTYDPSSTIQSWTSEKRNAESFTETQIDNGKLKVGLILKAEPEDKTLIFDPDFLNKIQFEENEIIRVGGRIDCVAEMRLNFTEIKEVMENINSEEEVEEIQNFLKKIDPNFFERLKSSN